MFIETLEFTIPVDLCDLFSSMKKGPKSNLEFPASVNSYGTTQDANIQVVLRSNKLTFKVDGVSSNSSMISKSECKTLKLSVFDVDCSIPEQEIYSEQPLQHSTPYINPAKRPRDRTMPMKAPPVKMNRSSFSESSPKSQESVHQSPTHSNTKIESEQINIKQEPDLIEIEPDPDPYEENSSHSNTHTSQAALDRLSHPHHSMSSSSSFHQNVPHVQDYSEPGPSHHGDQNVEDYLVYQDTGDNDYDDDNDNSADFGNDDERSSTRLHQPGVRSRPDSGVSRHLTLTDQCWYQDLPEETYFEANQGPKYIPCPQCGKLFASKRALLYHKSAVHDKVTHTCACGKAYMYPSGLKYHKLRCPVANQSS